MNLIQFSFDSRTFYLFSPDAVCSTVFPTIISSSFLSYLPLLMTLVNIFKVHTTENHSPVVLHSWVDPRWLLI